MATQESLDRVQQLYVAYYGRPADQEGQEYWADRLDAEGEGAIINAFGNSEEYAAKAEGQGNATLINAIYQQAFNREADPEGLTYYAGVLERGEKTLAEIATTIINAAGGQDRLVLNARVEAAAAYTAEFGAADAYDVDAAKAAVEAAKAGVNASALTEALTALSDAQTAEADFLEGQVDNDVINKLLKAADDAGNSISVVDNAGTPDNLVLTKLNEDLSQAQIKEAIEDVYAYAGSEVDAALDLRTVGGLDLGDSSFNTRSTAVQDELIADGIAAAQKVVADKEKVAETGVLNALASVQQGITRLDNSYKAQEEARTALSGEMAKFASVNSATLSPANADNFDLDTANNTFTINGSITVTLNANGTWTVPTGTDTSGLQGVDALLSAGNALGGALVTYDSAFSSLAASVKRAEDLQEGSDISTSVAKSYITEPDATADASVTFAVATELNDIISARQALSNLEEAVEDFEAARGVRDEAKNLADAVTDAQEAITDSAEDGGLGVALLTETNGDIDPVTGDVSFSGGDEVYLYNAADADDVNGDIAVAGFSIAGQDRIFFGEDYTLVELSGDWKASDNTGDAAALEIFWEQTGSVLNLYVENKAFAGNGSTDGDITEITLTGVSANDINFSNGYLTAGEPA